MFISTSLCSSIKFVRHAAFALLLSQHVWLNATNQQSQDDKLVQDFHEQFNELHISHPPGSKLLADYSTTCRFFDSYQPAGQVTSQSIRQVLRVLEEPLSCSSTLYCIVPGKTWTFENNVSQVQLLYENWHQIIHIVGAWAYRRCGESSCAMQDLFDLMFFRPNTLVQGWAPLHGALTFAISRLATKHAETLWNFTIKDICVSLNPAPQISMNCFHASGHGMFRISFDTSTYSQPDPCVDPRIKSFLISPEVLYESISLCARAPSVQAAAFCDGGVYDNIFAYGISSWRPRPDASVCFSSPAVALFGCFSYFFWWVQAGRYYFYRKQALPSDIPCASIQAESIYIACIAGYSRLHTDVDCRVFVNVTVRADLQGQDFRRWLACMHEVFVHKVLYPAWTFGDGRVHSPLMVSVTSRISNWLSGAQWRWMDHSLRSRIAMIFKESFEATIRAEDMLTAIEPLFPTWILARE